MPWSSCTRRRERGATAVEYALVMALVSLLIVGTAVILGARVAEHAAALVVQVGELLGVG
jgi:Flp pilus assembly pilin Flp